MNWEYVMKKIVSLMKNVKTVKSILEHIILNIGDTDGDMIVSSKIIGSYSSLF